MILSVNVLREKEKGHLSCTIKVLTSYQPMSGGLTAAFKHGAPAVTWLIKCRVKFESILWRMMSQRLFSFTFFSLNPTFFGMGCAGPLGLASVFCHLLMLLFH